MSDRGDERVVKKYKKANRLLRETEIEELNAILATYGGRRLIWRMLSQCGLYSSAPLDPADTQRFEGKRDIGLWIIEEMFTASPNAYTLIRSDAAARDATRQQIEQASRDATEEGED